MPYIKQLDRERIEEWMADCGGDGCNLSESLSGRISSAGELNYIFTRLALGYLARNGENYQHMNDIIGALEGCKLELYRRFIAPYEEKKIEQNGDVTN